MKTLSRSFLISSATFLGAVSIACASPVMDVKVTNSAGKVIYRGKTDAQGMFETKTVPPGNYVVQFNAAGTAKGGPLALMVHAGDQESSANSVPASKFRKGGVAMKVEVKSATVLTGQVAPAGSKMAQTAKSSAGTTTATPSNGKKSKLKTKVVKGETYVWIGGDDAMGSSFGGHWVPEGSAEGKRAEANAR
ncbi:MAG: hypothetical protein ABI233_00475 [Chthoniobacterales bacterium]